MIRATDEYWDFDRATYEDELDAWRERTAAPVASMPAARRSATRRVIAPRPATARPPRKARRHSRPRIAVAGSLTA
jgi:hypothetical protein